MIKNKKIGLNNIKITTSRKFFKMLFKLEELCSNLNFLSCNINISTPKKFANSTIFSKPSDLKACS